MKSLLSWLALSNGSSAAAGLTSFFSYNQIMVIIRRKVTRRQAFTEIILPPDRRMEFPTTDHEHNRILQIYLQDKPYPGICNDHAEFDTSYWSPKK